MFRITEDPSSGSLVQRLAKNYNNGSIVSIDMLEHFKYFIILILSTNYIFVNLLDTKVFNRH